MGSIIMTMLGTFLERSKIKSSRSTWIYQFSCISGAELFLLHCQSFQVALTFVVISTGLLIGAVIVDPLKIGKSS